MPAEIFFSQNLERVKVEMTQERQRRNSQSKQHMNTSVSKHTIAISKKEKPDALSNAGETAHFSPPASL